MKYYVQRQLQQYGPYSLEEVRRYVAQGNIVLADMARTEVMANWVPLIQLIGAGGPVATPTPGGAPAAVVVAPAGVVYAGAAPQMAPVAPGAYVAPMPPDFHWAAVLVLGVFTFGIFSLAWLIVECSFVKKIRPASDFILFLVLGLIPVLGIVFVIVGVFKMRDAIQEYYNTVEPINLRLSSAMTFFFAVLYFQYHFSRIAQWKKTGFLQPQ